MSIKYAHVLPDEIFQAIHVQLMLRHKTSSIQNSCELCSVYRNFAIGGFSVLLLFSIRTAPAIPIPSSPDSPPPDSYLDIPFFPQDIGLNKAMETLDDHGVKPFVKYWGDFLANPLGGKSQVADWFQLVVFGTQWDLERLVGWKGGAWTISGIDAGGDDIARNIGTEFTPSQAVTFRGAALFLLYFTQYLADERMELKLGRMSAGSIYARLPMMGVPVSGAVNGNPISLLYNASGFHATGKANWAGNIQIKPTADTYIQSGIFQATTKRMNGNYFNGLDFSFRRGDGIFLIAESGWSPTFFKAKDSSERHLGQLATHAFVGLPGLYQFGGYYQNYPMTTFLGTGSIQNIYGFYFQAQQMVWRSRSNKNHHFTIWSGLTYSPQMQIARFPVMAYGGVGGAGLIPYRDNDQLLLNYYIGGYSRDYSQRNIRKGKGSNTLATTLELSYIFQLTRQIQFQPDLQYFIQPSGSKSIPNALVLGFQISFIY